MVSELLNAMQLYVNDPQVRALIERTCDECEAELRGRPGMGMTYRALVRRLELTGAAAPLRSLWVFAFAPDGESDTHRHSNSTQYTCAWRGQGRLSIGEPEQAVTVSLSPPPGQSNPLHNWAVIPRGVFHHAVAGETGWCVVSFQTAAAEELQDEPFSGASHYYLAEGVNSL